MSRIPAKDLFRTVIRLALLQSTWCEGGMQSVGLAHCLLPGLRKLCVSKDRLKEFLSLLSEPFNTHPFLGGVVVGAVLHLVEDGKSPSDVKSFLRMSMGALAALGDPFLHSALPVFTALVSSLAAMLGGPLIGIITLLVLFNSVHLFIRLGGFIFGYRDGYKALERIGFWLSPSRSGILKNIASGVAGISLAVLWVFLGQKAGRWVELVITIGSIGVAFIIIKRRLKPIFLVLPFLGVCLVLEFFI